MDYYGKITRRIGLGVLLSAFFVAPMALSETNIAHADTAYRTTLPAGTFQIHVPVEISLVEDRIAKPFSVAPDIWYGITDGITVGIVHSGFGTNGNWGGVPGRGICLAGDGTGGCPEIYDNAGLELRFNLLEGSFATALQVGGFASNIMSDSVVAPLNFSGKVGLSTMFGSEYFRLLFNPNVSIAITERDGVNQDTVSIPLSLILGTNSFSFGLQAAVSAPFEDAADNWVLATSLGLQAGLGDSVAIFAVFSLPATAVADRLKLPGSEFSDARSITAGLTFSL